MTTGTTTTYVPDLNLEVVRTRTHSVQRYRPAARVHERATRPAIRLQALPLARRMQRETIRADRVDDDVRRARVPLDEL